MCIAIKRLVEAPKPGAELASRTVAPSARQRVSASARQRVSASARQRVSASTRPTIQQQLQQSEAERLCTHAGYALRDMTEELARHRDFCDRQQRQILANKAWANNNLAGAVYEQSIATAAAATRYDTRGRDLQAELDEARRQCAARGCS